MDTQLKTNSIVRDDFGIMDMTWALRHQLLDSLTDAELAYRLPGANPSLGELCREMGETETSYIQSFKTFKLDFSYRNVDPGLANSVTRLRSWFELLENDFKAALSALSEEEVAAKLIDRGGWTMPVRINMFCYREALLIFYGKASLYLRALNKPLNEQWQSWIG